MALCESQLDSGLVRESLRGESPGSEESKEEKKPKLEPNGDIYGLNQVPGGLPLSVDYRSPVSHFVPPAVELYAARQKSDTPTTGESSAPSTPVKRKRGRPRVDKTSPEYLANLAARKQAKEMAAMMNNRATDSGGEKRKRGRPRVDKTSPEYLARKRAREIEAMERKAKRDNKRRATGAKPISKMPTRAMKTLPALKNNKNGVPPRKLTQKSGNTIRKSGDRKVIIRRASNGKFMKRKDSAASSSAGESTPRMKRKYTKRTPSTKKDAGPTGERVKGKRGRPRKVDQMTAMNAKQPQQGKIRVRSNLMPTMPSEPITLDSDDEPDLGSPSQQSDSLSLDENLRALRHIHEKYANIDKDDLYGTHLLAANFKKPNESQRRDDDEVLSVRSSEGCASVKEMETRVEKLEDSSNSDSESTTSGSGSSSSGSSSSSSSGSSTSSDTSDSETEDEGKSIKTEPATARDTTAVNADDNDRSAAESDSDPETTGPAPLPPPPGEHDEISESDNESADKSFQCHICRKWYSTRVTLKIHRRVHQNRGGGQSRSRQRSSDRYECDICSDTFSRREKLWDHKAQAHRGSMTVRCEVCRKCFEDDNDLAVHDRTHTPDERAGRCSSCGATFARYDQLRRHLTSAHGAPSALAHACAQCGKRFGHAHSLTRHLHNHAKQLYRCVVCKASFVKAEQLAQHLNSHLANYKRLKP